MLRICALSAVLLCLFAGASARSGTVETVEGQRYSGAVIGVGSDSLQFAWQKSKDQPEEIRKGDIDRAFEAQGDETVAMSFAMSGLASVNGAPPEAFKALYSGNLFYRLVQMTDRGRVQALSNGNFVNQIKGIVVFLLTLCLLMPILIMFVAKILPGDSLGFFGGVGYSILLFCVGLALATGSSLLTANVAFFAVPWAQYLLSVVLVALVSLVVHVATNHSFWQGLGFTAAWAFSVALGSKVALAVLAAGIVGKVIQ